LLPPEALSCQAIGLGGWKHEDNGIRNTIIACVLFDIRVMLRLLKSPVVNGVAEDA
jgi:hypothetical protein